MSTHFSALATDGASVNDVLFRTASRYLLTLYDIPENGDRHIYCLAHVINLAVQAILSALNEAEPCEDLGDENDTYLLHKDAPIHYDVSQDQDLEELEGNREKNLLGEDKRDELAEALSLLGLEIDAVAESEEVERTRGASELQRVCKHCAYDINIG